MAGVSLATASRAMNDRSTVAVATRERVMAAAASLDYAPSTVARSLRLRSTGLIGFVVPDVGSSFYANALKGAQHRLEAAGYQVALMDTDERPERELEAVRALAAREVDGLLICATGAADEAIRSLARLRSVPLVFFDNIVHGVGSGSVTLSNETGTRRLVDHLATVHGHHRIGYIGGLERETSGAERSAGFRLGVVANGLAGDQSLVRQGDWMSGSGARETAALLDLPEPPTAIVYADGLMAIGGMALLRERGRRVPGDIAIVAFDDPETGALLDPPLTALVRRDREIGDLAASLLLRVLDHDDAGPMDVHIPMELVIRRSCGCVP
jgi:LacI family transcriptional regulator